MKKTIKYSIVIVCFVLSIYLTFFGLISVNSMKYISNEEGIMPLLMLVPLWMFIGMACSFLTEDESDEMKFGFKIANYIMSTAILIGFTFSLFLQNEISEGSKKIAFNNLLNTLKITENDVELAKTNELVANILKDYKENNPENIKKYYEERDKIIRVDNDKLVSIISSVKAINNPEITNIYEKSREDGIMSYAEYNEIKNAIIEKEFKK